MSYTYRVLLGVIATSCILSGSVRAQSDHPAKAKALKMDLVRFYEECTTPNSTDANGNPVCSPPMTPPTCIVKFGPKGGGSIQLTASKSILRYQIKVHDVLLTADGSTYEGPMTLQVPMRVTVTGQHTYPESLLTVPFDVAKGKATKKGSVTLTVTGQAEELARNVGIGPITVLECGQVAPFAVPGVLLR